MFFSIFLRRRNIEPCVGQTRSFYCCRESPGDETARLWTLKVSFNIVHGMLFGKTDGFSWDFERRRVIADKPVWDAYLRSHRNASKFKGKSFPYYEELCAIFGVNCANGDCARDHKDKDEGEEEEVEGGGVDKEAAQEEVIAVEKIDHQVSISISPSPALASNDETKSKPKKRKSSESSDELVEVIRESTNMLTTEISKWITRICLALENATASEKRSKINGELLKLPGLTMLERYRATRIIGCDVGIIDIFFSIRDNEKEEWMKTLIHDLR